MVFQQFDRHEEEKVQKLQEAFQLWREDLQKQLPSGKLKNIESKLAALEGSILSAGGACASLPLLCCSGLQCPLAPCNSCHLR